jgi:type IV secretory pathway TraG/TraD family ATPase VirD4
VRRTRGHFCGYYADGRKLREIRFEKNPGERPLAGMILMGPARSGKDASIGIPMHLKDEYGSAIISDPRCQYMSTCARQQRRYGKRIYKIGEAPEWMPPHINDLAESVHINTIGGIDPHSLDLGYICDSRAADLIPVSPNDQNAWVGQGARKWTSGVVYGLVKYGERNDRNLVSLHQIMTSPEIKVFAEAMVLKGDPLLTARISDLTGKGLDHREAWIKLSAIATDLGFIGNERTMLYLDPKKGLPELDPRTFRSSPPSVLYIIPPIADMEAAAPFMRLVSSYCTATLSRNPRGTSVTLLMTEFASMKRVDSFEDLISTASGSNMIIFPIIQNWGQLVSIYGKERANSFLSAAGAKMFLPPADLETAKLASSLSGMGEVYTTSLSIHPTGGRTIGVGQAPRQVMTPDEVADMGPNRMMIKFEHMPNVVLAYRQPYYADKSLRGMWDQDPMFER